MFKIDSTTNRITPLQAHKFGDLNFTVRNNLQRWLVSHVTRFENIMKELLSEAWRLALSS